MNEIKIIYGEAQYIESFYDALACVARERIYIEMTEPPPLEKVREFQTQLMAKNGPVYYALDGERVVGWCDVFPYQNPRLSHRGGLGMGLLPEYRGRRIGSALLSKIIDHSKNVGLEKIELNVYTTNLPAIRLYRNFGFEDEGVIRKYRKLEGEYFDCLAMARFLA